MLEDGRIEVQKIIQKLFIFADNRDQEVNRQESLIVNPEMFRILFQQISKLNNSQKITILSEVSQIFAANSLNPCILANRDKQILEFNYSIFDDLITFVFSLKLQLKDNERLLKILKPFVSKYPITCRNIKNVIATIAKDFYHEQFKHRKLNLAIKLLQQLYINQVPFNSEPSCYFFMYGPNSGVRLLNQDLKWTLFKGFYFYMNFYVEGNPLQSMNLLHIYINEDQFQLSIDEEGFLEVKVFSASKKFRLRKLQTRKWYFLKMAYCLKTGIIRNSFQLLIYLDGEPFEIRDLPVPSPKMNDCIEQLGIGRDFYGKINVAAISRNQLHHWPKKGINNWEQINTLLVANKDKVRSLFVFYSPLITTQFKEKKIVYEITSQHHAEILQNTGIFHNPFDSVDINYYAGIYTLLPFFYVLKFYKYEQYSSALEDTLSLMNQLFESGYKNIEQEAVNCQICSIIAEFINQMDERYLTEQCIANLAIFRDLIENQTLKQEYFYNLLWKIRSDRISSPQIVNKLFRLISRFYYQDFYWSIKMMPLEDILWYVIDNFQPKNRQKCCILHCWQLFTSGQFDEDLAISIDEQYKNKSFQLQSLLKFIAVKVSTQNKKLNPFLSNENSIIYKLLLHNYSICFKNLLLTVILAAVKEEPILYIEKSYILQTSYILLSQAELKDEIVPIVRVIAECIRARDRYNINLVKDMVIQIGCQLDKLYMKKYIAVRLRSKSEAIKIKNIARQRKYSHNNEDVVNSKVEKQKKFKEKMIKLKHDKKIKLENDKELFDLIVNICFKKQTEGGQVLVDEFYINIVQPYYKICCINFKVKLIEMIRTTVLLGTKVFDNPIESLQKFDRIYKFMLTEFILKQLDPDFPDYVPNENSNYINRNVFFVINHMMGLLKYSWHDLYQYIVRLIALLQQAKKDVQMKTKRPLSEIVVATKIFIRKITLRILNHTQKSIENITNMIFFVYLVIFNNQNQNSVQLFDYFKTLQKYFFMHRFQILSPSDHTQINKNTFIDKKIIIQTFKSFKPEIDLMIFGKKLTHSIRAYLQPQNNEYSPYLFSIRQIFLSRVQFKPLNTPETKGIRSMMSMFMGGNEEESLNQHYAYLAEITFLLLGLSMQAAINEEEGENLKEVIELYEFYSKLIVLACTKDNLKKSEHETRNKKFPKNLAYFCIHFLYEMLENCSSQTFKLQIQESIYNILQFFTTLMVVLSEKVGHPETLGDALMLSDVMQDVEQYNFFIFDVFQGVLTLPEIRLFPSLDKAKAIDVLNHPKMKNHFKNTPRIFIQKQMKQVVEIHRLNIQIILRDLEQKLTNIQINENSLVEKITDLQIGFEEEILQHMKKLNLQYRHAMRVWRKVWKRLRVYHYYWSVSMNQRQEKNQKWSKFVHLPFKHKFGKFTHLSGLRPILEIQPNEPWHVRKAQLDQEISYRASNFMLNLYKSSQVNHSETKPKSFIQKLFQGSDKNENQFLVDWIKHNSTRRGYLKLTQQKLIFTYDSTFQKDSHINFKSFTLAEYRPIEKNWPLVTIQNIMRRRYLAQNQCLLIEFEDTSSLIFNFRNRNVEDFLQKISSLQNSKNQMTNFLKMNKVNFYTKNFQTANRYALEELTNLWRAHKISNLHYMMEVNKFSGRSYLDPVNYPVLPWIIANYDYKELIFRDLGKTLGALGSETRRQLYINKFDSQDPFSNVEPYQYGTHYSSPGVIFNFLVRISPYTEAARTLQGGRFDLSDRIFSSVKICWHSVTSEVSDVRELIPQFYYLPEFLINIEYHDFGITQLKDRVHNVKLPLWGQNAYDFIIKQRRAFESDQIQENIHKWIDLIFGFKQKGKLAQQNLNLYYYLTYQNSINLNEVDDQIERTSIQAQIIHFGQTPSQIFHKPHPEKARKEVKFVSQLYKIKFMGIIQCKSQLLILNNNKFNQLFILNDPVLMCVSYNNFLQIKSQTPLLRANSRQNLYHMQDLTIFNRVQIFGNNNFIIIGSYINGDIIIYSVSSGKKLIHKEGSFKSFVYVNEDENLIICGCKNGLVEVYEIIYTENGQIILTLISSEYYMYPIQHISEGGGFYSISSGNLIIINKITRGLAYVNKKEKMKGCKMIRSIQSKRKVLGSYIITNPLYCIVFYNLLEINIYSINGQFLKSKQIQLLIKPVIVKGTNFEEYVVVLQQNSISFLRIPELTSVQNIPVPQKQYVDIKVLGNKVYLVSSNGEIMFFYYKHEE